MGFALISHPARFLPTWRRLMAPMEIPESKIPVAVAQGWIVIARDAGIYDDRVLKALTPVDVPVQSNPRRRLDEGEDGA